MTDKAKNWEEVSREEVFRKYDRAIEKVVYRLPHGKEADFYLNSGHGIVICLALTKDKKVILERQFMPGPKKILFGIPGGGVKLGEALEQAMERELLEETGYRGKIQFVASVSPSVYATFVKYFFIAVDCEKVAEPKLEDNGESIEVVIVPLDEFRKHIRTGQIMDLDGCYLCLDYLNLL